VLLDVERLLAPSAVLLEVLWEKLEARLVEEEL
jgi:hypothetical protein